MRRVITLFVEDVLNESAKRIADAKVRSADDVRHADRPLVAASTAFSAADADIKAFLFPAMYRHPQVMRVREKAAHVIARLFPHFLERPDLMPAEWAALARGANDDTGRARAVCDYIAGMTDRYALGEYARLFGESVDLK